MADKVEKAEKAEKPANTGRRSFLKGGLAGVGVTAALGGGGWAASSYMSGGKTDAHGSDHAGSAQAAPVDQHNAEPSGEKSYATEEAAAEEPEAAEEHTSDDHTSDDNAADDHESGAAKAESHKDDHAADDKRASKADDHNAHAEPIKSSLSPDEALAKLKAGNRKFAKATGLCRVDILSRRKAVAEAQAPWATVLTCADSRVAPEILFGGLNLGELFVCRNAGNMADTSTLGTIEYGAEHLGSPLVVVLGHERCGAVAAACKVAKDGVALPGSIAPMVNAILPAALSQMKKKGDFVDNVMRESARRTADHIRNNSQIMRSLIEQGRVKVVYGSYDLDTGLVEFLS